MLDLRPVHSLIKQERFPEAWRLANGALDLQPDNPEALYLVGCCLRAMGNVGLASVALGKALAKEQKQPNLWMVYAAALHDLNRWEEAEKAFLHVHRMLPNDPMPPANIGATFVQRGLWRDAINWCDKSLGLDPENHIARISKGFACLSLGRWKDAWQYSEALYGNHLPVRIYCDPEEPEWDGTKGQTVVVQCDQGVGDQIMFAQCLKELQRDSKTVIVECQKRLEPFFKRNFPGVRVYGTLKDDSAPWASDYKIDAHIHISGLGRFYRLKDSDFPRVPYITPEPKKLAKWRDWLKQFPKPWVGVTWKGGIQATQTHLRSMTLADLEPVLSLPGTFIDLSYQDTSGEVARWNIDNKAQVVRPPIDVADYEDTIALVAALDEVVTVTTTVAHVCGALGKKAHVMVPAVAQWRYAYRCGDGMLWYSPESVCLYRQNAGEAGWGPTVNRVKKALCDS